jgi:ParB-like chromosome segregation protein Spo0J
MWHDDGAVSSQLGRARGTTMAVTLTSEQIAVDRIKVDKSRQPDEEIVRQLMLSIPVVGVLQPIVLHRPGAGLGINLVFGRNRLEALKRLKVRATLGRVLNGDTPEIREWIERATNDENAIRRISALPADPNVVSLIERKRAVAS